MTLKCSKCKGWVMLETYTSNKKMIELSCVHCGKRWFLQTKNNAFGRFLANARRGRVA